MKRFSSITAHAAATVLALVMISSGLGAQGVPQFEIANCDSKIEIPFWRLKGDIT